MKRGRMRRPNIKKNSKAFVIFLLVIYTTTFLLLGLQIHATYNADCDDINALCSNPTSEFCDASSRKCLCRTGDGYSLKPSTQKCVQSCGSWGRGEQICLTSTNEQPCKDMFGATTYETNSETECILCCRRPISSGRCGDGIKNGREECDDADLGGKSKCTDIGLGGGNLRCTAACTIDKSACTRCGPNEDEYSYYDEDGNEIFSCVTRPLRVSHTPNDRNPTTRDTVSITAYSNNVMQEVSIDVKTSGSFELKRTCNNMPACEYKWENPPLGTYEYRARDNRGITSNTGSLKVVEPCTTIGQTRCDDDQCRTSCTPTPPGTFKLTLQKSGSGAGTVSSTPTGINCGQTCDYNFNSGTSVTLTATPASGSTFAGWGGDCTGTSACSVTMSVAKSVTATFNGQGGAITATPNSVTVGIVSPGQGKIESTISGGTKPYSIKPDKRCSDPIAYCDLLGVEKDSLYVEGRSLSSTSVTIKDNANNEVTFTVTVTSCNPATKPTNPCTTSGQTYQCVNNNWECQLPSNICTPSPNPPCSFNFGGTTTITNSPADYTTEQARAWRIAQCIPLGNGHSTLIDFVNKYKVAWPDTTLTPFSGTTSDKVKFPTNGWIDLINGGPPECWKFAKVEDLCKDDSECLTSTGSRCTEKTSSGENAWCSCTSNSNCKSGMICDPTYKRCGFPGSSTCGNGVKDPGEECDPGPPEKLNGATCQSLGKGSGTLTCHSSGDDKCTYDFEECSGSGGSCNNNGRCDAGETFASCPGDCPRTTSDCNDPTGATPSITSITPTTVKKSQSITISGNDLTRTIQAYPAAGAPTTLTGSVNSACKETTITVPSDAPTGKYTLKIYKARDKISNGIEITVKGNSNILKYTPDEDATGYCDEDSQCLVNPFGKDGTTECINSGEYSEDNYCENGIWSTRTKLLALKLLKLKSGDYTLFCDKKENTLNNLLYQTDSGQTAADAVSKAQANNFCVLKTKDNLVVAASMNGKPEDLSGIANVLGVANCNSAANDGLYYPCDTTKKVFYNKKLNTFIYSSNSITLPPVDESSSTLIGIIKNIIASIKRLILKPPFDETYMTEIKKFRTLYLAEQSGKTIKGSIDGKSLKNMVIEYDNFDVNICSFVDKFSEAKQPKLSGISCKSEGKNYVVLAQGSASNFNPESVWPDMTSKLRIKI